MVVFRTDDRSRHGFSQPIADGRWRRSLALYYYTADEAESFSGDLNTYWSRLPVTGVVNRVRHAIYEAMMLCARGLSLLAHRFDPNTGRRARRGPEDTPQAP
jgi:hypothetical protein